MLDYENTILHNACDLLTSFIENDDGNDETQMNEMHNVLESYKYLIQFYCLIS